MATQQTTPLADLRSPGEYGGVDVSLFWLQEEWEGDLLTQGTWQTDVQTHLGRINASPQERAQVANILVPITDLMGVLTQDEAKLVLLSANGQPTLWLERRDYHIEF